jgi:hypothetical protein
MEAAAWILLITAGLVSSLAFGHSLGAPLRVRKMIDNMPKPPKPIPYHGFSLYKTEPTPPIKPKQEG